MNPENQDNQPGNDQQTPSQSPASEAPVSAQPTADVLESPVSADNVTSPQTNQATPTTSVNATVTPAANGSADTTQATDTLSPTLPANPEPNAGATQTAPQGASGLAIAGLILAFFVPIIGLILSVIALTKSGKENRSKVIPIIGLVVSLLASIFYFAIFVGLITTSFQAAQVTARDAERRFDIDAIHENLQANLNPELGYPRELTADTLKGVASEALESPKNGAIVNVTPIEDATELQSALDTNLGTDNYYYIPYGCVSTGCYGYVLQTGLEDTSDGKVAYGKTGQIEN